jgi:hypothetical protein
MLRLCLSILIVVICGAPVLSAGNSSTAAIQIVSCPQDADSKPLVEQREGAIYRPVRATVVSSARGLFLATLTLPEGNNNLQVESKNCRASVQFSTLAGQTRAVSVATAPRSFSMSFFHNAIAGRLPLTPSLVQLVSPLGEARIVDSQDGAYYVERVAPQKYVLRISIAGGYQADIPLDASKLGSSGLLVRDVSIDELRKHLGERLDTGRTLEECFWCFQSASPLPNK